MQIGKNFFQNQCSRPTVWRQISSSCTWKTYDKEQI